MISSTCHGSNKESEWTDWKTWRPWYERIISDFGYDTERDRKSASILSHLLEDRKNVFEEELASLLRGREAVVFGPADPYIPDPQDQVYIAAGSGLSAMLDLEIVPDMVVTDLDGDIETLCKVNDEGAIAVVHAHGDNIDKIEQYVPSLKGPVCGTTQVRGLKNVHNFGGFTDGDRAVFLALHFAAKDIILSGFDFENPVMKAGGDIGIKRKKLKYAEKLIWFASEHFDAKIVILDSR